MKLYIGNRTINDESFKSVKDLEVVNYMAEDGECDVVILDQSLTRYDMNYLESVISQVKAKVKLGGTLIINDIDFDLLSYYYSKNNNIKDINSLAIQIGGFKSFITMELIKSILSQFSDVTVLQMEYNNLEFKIVVQRNA